MLCIIKFVILQYILYSIYGVPKNIREMERIVNLQIEKLPEGVYLATSDNIQGLVVQGNSVVEIIEIARDVAKKLIFLSTQIDNKLTRPFNLPGPYLRRASDGY